MTRKTGLEAAGKILATLSLLGVSLGVSAAAPSPQQVASDAPAAGAHGTLKLAEVKSKLQSNQFKVRNTIGNSRRVGIGVKNSLSPQPLPPGGDVSINPQPLPPGGNNSLNPQPLPPGPPDRIKVQNVSTSVKTIPPGPPNRIRVQNVSTGVKTINVRTPQINPRINGVKIR